MAARLEQVRSIWFIWSIWFVLLLDPGKRNKLNKPNKRDRLDRPDRPNKQERPTCPRVSWFDRLTVLSQVEGRATVGAAEVGNDESRVGDWVCREGGCVLIGYRCAQSLGRLTDGKRERRVLLNLPEMGHRIPAPLWNREPHQPRFGGASHGASSTDSRLPVVAVLPRGLGCREFPFNQRCWCHQARSFRCAW